jgi:hypothetical protein
MSERKNWCIFLAAASAVAVMPSRVHAARQKALGLTSAAITATNPTQRQMQLIFDPGVPTYNVQSFQLSVQFNSNLLDLVPNSVVAISPFNVPSGIQSVANFVTVPGSTTPDMAQPGDVDLFLATFHITSSGTPLNTPFTFTFGAKDASDFITAVDSSDPNNPAKNLTNAGPNNIVSTIVNGSVSQNYATFMATSGSWSNVNNWALGVLPQAGAFVRLSGDAGLVTVNLDSNANATGLASLTLDASAGRSITLQQTQGNLTVTGNEIVGDNGSGVVTLTGGQHGVNKLILGNNAESTGTFTLNSAGSLAVTTDEYVGLSGSGTVNQGGGVHTIGGKLYIAANATGAGVFNLSGGTLSTASTVNNGTFSQTGGTSNLGAVSGSGAMAIGGGPATATVSSFTQASVTVNGQGKLVVNVAATRATNAATTLSILGTGQLDLGNNNLLVDRTATPFSTIAGYVNSGRANNWTGPGITSSVAASGPVGVYGIAYVDGGDPNTSGFGIDPTKIFVRPSLIGDTTLSGSVTNASVRAIILRGHYNDGQSNHTWVDGDFDGDGQVTNSDVRAIILSGNYNNGVTFATSSQAVATPTLTGRSGSASPATTTLGSLGDGKLLHYIYNSVTGDVWVKFDGVDPTKVQEFDPLSTGGKFSTANANAIFSTGLSTASPTELDALNTGSSYPDATDLGNILPANLTNAQLTSDLTLLYSVKGGGTQATADLIVTTPEPTTISLLATMALGLMVRRRRRGACSLAPRSRGEREPSGAPRTLAVGPCHPLR